VILNRLKKSELDEILERRARCHKITSLDIYWNDEKRVIVTVEKRKNHYDSRTVKVFLVGDDKMQRHTRKATSNDAQTLATLIAENIQRVDYQGGRGVGVRDPHTALDVLLSFDDDEKSEPIAPVAIQEIQNFPDEGGLFGFVCDEQLYPTRNSIYITDEMLLHHIIVTGTTGFGKTTLTGRIVTEVNKENKTVLVLTPDAHLTRWTSLANSVEIDDEMIEGKINIPRFSYADNLKEESKNILTELIEKYASQTETSYVKLLLVIDEAKQFDQESIENCVRTLRKYGVATLLVYHKFGGKDGIDDDIRTNVSTHISTHTSWNPDIEHMKRHQPKSVTDYVTLFSIAPRKGYCLIRSRFINSNRPLICKFLQEYEKPPSMELVQKEAQIEENESLGKRHMIIYDIIKNTPNITASSIRNRLKSRGMDVDNSTISRDLKELQEGDYITISETGDNNQKHYRANSLHHP